MPQEASTIGPVRERDLYALLGVADDATTEEITTAFRARAKALHPDRAPSDADSEERFKELSRAYATLTRPRSRAAYDARRRAATTGTDATPPEEQRHHQVLTTPGRARAAIWGGIVCMLAGVAISPVLLSLETSPDTLGRDVTLWLVVAKLVICGAVLVGAGWWRLVTLGRPGATSRSVPTGR